MLNLFFFWSNDNSLKSPRLEIQIVEIQIVGQAISKANEQSYQVKPKQKTREPLIKEKRRIKLCLLPCTFKGSSVQSLHF